jgi:pimeloyl-ACP methyl ester carboxylesterase
MCPDGSSISECNSFLASEYGQDLQHYTLTNAARDLEYLFTDIRHDDEEAELFVYAVGYGAVLLNRFLILRDDLLDAAIIDSPGPTEPFFYQTEDQDLMEARPALPFCPTLLPPADSAFCFFVFCVLDCHSFYGRMRPQRVLQRPGRRRAHGQTAGRLRRSELQQLHCRLQ